MQQAEKQKQFHRGTVSLKPRHVREVASFHRGNHSAALSGSSCKKSCLLLDYGSVFDRKRLDHGDLRR
jgi:hypothetical protein